MRITSLIALLLTSMLHAEISTEQSDVVLTKISQAVPEQTHAILPQPTKISTEQAEIVRVQIFLDQKQFGPGVIDGKSGTYTKQAAASYNRLHGRAPDDWDSIQKDAAAAVPEIYATAIVPKIIHELVDTDFPAGDNRALHAKRRYMHYKSVAEFMAERYHTSVAFLNQLNGEETMAKATVRSALTVPNIEPFKIESLAHGRTYKNEETLSKRWAVVDTNMKQLRIYEPLEQQENLPPVAIPLEEALPTEIAVPMDLTADEEHPDDAGDTSQKALIVPDDSETLPELTPYDEPRALLVAAFPITPGQPQFIRRGIWKLMNSIELPTWRYDPSLLKKGVRGTESLEIPYGPNNPVGVIWMGLSKRGIGIHGTDNPDTIGRARSAGCIRLANWDAVMIPSLLRPGATVIIK